MNGTIKLMDLTTLNTSELDALYDKVCAERRSRKAALARSAALSAIVALRELQQYDDCADILFIDFDDHCGVENITGIALGDGTVLEI